MTRAIIMDPDMGPVVMNDTGIDDHMVMGALMSQHPEVASMVRWGNDIGRRSGGMFERDRFVTPDNIYEQMKVCYDAAANDDIVSGVMEMTESLAFNKIYMDTDDEDEQDIWNQILAEINLDARIREMWRELYQVSQVYVATWYGRRTYKVRGKSKDGVRRKKEFRNLIVPIAMAILDPLKVVPVGNFMFGQDQLAYAANRDEGDSFRTILNNREDQDETITTLVVGEYTPSRNEAKMIADYGLDPYNLFLLDPSKVWKHTVTKPAYKRFADIRMTTIFELLDIKHQLRAMDRAHLIGGTNFIILIKKGTDQKPALPSEIANLQNQVKAMARVPVIVGDHRLEISIITPKLDSTLSPDRYNALDARIAARLWQMFFVGNFQAGGRTDSSSELVRVVARSMEARRHMLRRTLEEHVLLPTWKMNEDQLQDEPKLRFSPKQIALSFDAAYATYLMDLRDRGEVSRETLLSHIDISQAEEARRREREAEKYDQVFQTVVPFSGQQPGQTPTAPGQPAPPQDPKTAGRNQGGNRSGGGSAPGTGQGKKTGESEAKGDTK